MDRRRMIRRAAALIAFAGVVLLASPPLEARRLVTVTDISAFDIQITLAPDDVTVDCSGGFVRVRVNFVPTVYTTPCVGVTALTITAIGLFKHTIDIQAVTAADFPLLASPVVSGGGRDDHVEGSPLPDIILGNGGDDELYGHGGNDFIDGGSSDDVIFAGPGNDLLFGGTGLDQFNWQPGDGSDTMDGGSERDTMAFDGSAAAELFNITANGGGFIFTRDVGAITMTATNVELISLRAFGGDDVVNTVGLVNTEQHLDGGAQLVADTINLNAQGACVTVGVGTFSVPGAQLITFTDFEIQNILNPCGGGVPAMGPWFFGVLVAAMGAIAIAALSRRKFAPITT